MSKEVTDIAVVICTYSEGRWNDLVQAVGSVLRQTRPARDLVVVVDHNPGLLSRVRHEFPGLTAVENWQSPGLSGARNTGLASTNASVIAFLDDDASAAPDWLERLEPGYQDTRVLGVGGFVAPVWQAGRPAWFPQEFDWVVGCSYRGLPESAGEVRNMLGCNMSFRREVFEVVGGFQSGIGRIGTYPAGCEETELCIRARRAWPERFFLYDPQVRVSHQVPAGRGTWRYYRTRCYAEGLSKALVAQSVGSTDGLASERRHALRTLPAAVAKDLAGVALHGDVWGLGRAGAIVAGLGFATAGLLSGRWRLA
ncbi:MAG: glycosyltransferase family 2 protein [Chloroflexi bacterium]|nr:MAG: glycosyltransferase family 2 protein [Chloroflexota bacterium]